MRAALLLRVMLQSWWLLGWTRMKWLYSFSCGFFGVVIFGSWWARLVLAALGDWIPVLAFVGSAGVAACLATRVLPRGQVIV